MPNHYQVVGLCSGDYETDLTPLNRVNLCEIIAPLPEELRTIVASNPPCRYRNKQTGEWHPDVNGPTENRDGYDRIELTQAECDELQAKYSAKDWWEWQVANWGTKWGTYDLTAMRLGGDGCPVLIAFQSAWCPPSPAMMRKIEGYLRDTYSITACKWIGHDPYDGKLKDIEVEEATTCQPN